MSPSIRSSFPSHKSSLLGEGVLKSFLNVSINKKPFLAPEVVTYKMAPDVSSVPKKQE
jgi:hypothetical protein